jgi:hypothetical protein
MKPNPPRDDDPSLTCKTIPTCILESFDGDAADETDEADEAGLAGQTTDSLETRESVRVEAEVPSALAQTPVPTPPAPVANTRLVIRRSRFGGRAEEPHLDPSSEYALGEKIGEGACGVVYGARQKTIDRDVAVKVIRPELSRIDQIKALFLSEAVVTGDLDHPNIVPVYDLGVDQHDGLFYSMKKVKGVSWKKVMAEKKIGRAHV